MNPTRAAAGAAVLLLGAALSACSTTVQDLQPGDCLNQSDLQGAKVSEVTALSCSEPHDAEVYAEITLPEGDYPGDDAVQAQVEEHCRTTFEEFIGVPFESSELYFSYLAPAEEGWTEVGDRTGLCIVLADEETTGSLAVARR